MKILHIGAMLTPEMGGPTKVIFELTEALVEKGAKVTIVATTKGSESKITHPKGVPLKLFEQGFPARLWTCYSTRLAQVLRQEAFKFDIIHIHEIWHYPHYAAYCGAKKANKPYIVTIHGELDPWCLDYKAFRKRIYGYVIQKHILKEAKYLHALTQEELKHIKAFGIETDAVVIPNGVNPKEFQNLPPREDMENLYPELKDKKVVLFLSRIHPKKGLDILVKAFGNVTKERDNIRLLIVGPDNDGYQVQVQKILQAEGILDKVIFTGMLTGRKKLAVLGGSDFFVLPSYSEGFSMAILEALICKLPVIITDRCNFPEVAEVKAGIVIEPDVDQLVDAFVKLLENPQLGKKMGEYGQALVLKQFIWDSVAEQMIVLYEEVLRKNSNYNLAV